MSLVVSSSQLRELEATERMLARPLTTVRRIAVASIAPFPTAALARLIARMAARHRAGRILYATPEWADFAEPSAERLAAAPPGFGGLLRVHGTTWVGSPELDDRFFDVAVADSGVVALEAVPALARERDAVCLVVPVARAAAEEAVALAEQLTAAGRRVVVAFDRTRPGRASWARAVTPLLTAPAVTIERDAALAQPVRTLATRTLLTAAVLAGHLMTDPVGAVERRATR